MSTICESRSTAVVVRASGTEIIVSRVTTPPAIMDLLDTGTLPDYTASLPIATDEAAIFNLLNPEATRNKNTK